MNNTSEYIIYLSGLLIVGLWLYVRPKLGLKALFILWWVGLLFHTSFLPSLLGKLLGELLRVAGLPRLGDMPAPCLYAITWIGAVLMLRALLGLTLWSRPKRLIERIWIIGFLLSLILSPVVHSGDYLVTFLMGPSAFVRAIDWVFVFIGVPWLWWFRWRDKLTAKGVVAGALTAFVSFCVLFSNMHFSYHFDSSQDRFLIDHWAGAWSGEPSSEFSGPWSNLPRLAWQVKQYCEIYALFFLFSLLALIRPKIHKISRRMIASHLVAGLVPAVLILIFLLAAGTLFLAAYRSSVAVGSLESASRELRNHVRQQYAISGQVTQLSFSERLSGEILLTHEGNGPVRIMGRSFPGVSLDSLLLLENPDYSVPLVVIGREAFLRARLDTLADGKAMRVEVLVPVDSLWMERVSDSLGKPTRLILQYTPPGSFSLGGSVAGSIGPVNRNRNEIPGGRNVSCFWWNGKKWDLGATPVLSYASFGEIEKTLFVMRSAEGRMIYSYGLLVIWFLWLVAIFLMGVTLWTGRNVFGMARSITRSVQSLTRASQALSEGHFSHRIVVEGKDELSGVATAFNRMAEGLERLREVEQQAQRLENELEIARQVQQNLFPKELPQPEAWQFAALCRPARAVGGDYYDLFDIDSARIAFALGDVSGKGLGPSLLMSSVHTLIRSASPEELEHLPRLISRLNDHLERSTSPEMFVTLFVGVLDTKTGLLRYVNGGHNPPILLPGGGAGPVRLERGGIVVGILPETPYREGQVHLDPGSLLVLYSDGVTEAVNENGDMFEEERLLEVLSRVRGEPASLILSSVLESVDGFVGNNEQADDISLIVMKRQS